MPIWLTRTDFLPAYISLNINSQLIFWIHFFATLWISYVPYSSFLSQFHILHMTLSHHWYTICYSWCQCQLPSLQYIYIILYNQPAYDSCTLSNMYRFTPKNMQFLFEMESVSKIASGMYVAVKIQKTNKDSLFKDRLYKVSGIN